MQYKKDNLAVIETGPVTWPSGYRSKHAIAHHCYRLANGQCVQTSSKENVFVLLLLLFLKDL